MRTWAAPVAFAALALPAAGGPGPVSAQELPDLIVRWQDQRVEVFALDLTRGYVAFPVNILVNLGWRVGVDAAGAVAQGPDGTQVELWTDSPFFHWDGEPLQLTDPVYRRGPDLMVPVQFLADFLPRRLPGRYAFDTRAMRLDAGNRSPAARAAADPPPPARDTRPTPPGDRPVTDPRPTPPADRPVPDSSQTARDTVSRPAYGEARPDTSRPSAYAGTRVVVIDAGHGGHDPGSSSRSGVQEKSVALGIALAMAERLKKEPGLEVHLIRDDDTFVPVWNRGPRGTSIKGDRPGVFVSIHANAFDSPARGFETYFLSEARTEHERRVAAIENAPVRLPGGEVPPEDDLGFILRELRNLDHQHWSNFLAELVQDEVGKVHPGPNRGVKQAPLAVLTNVLMPSVLVEIGYLSHAEEARLLARRDFQEKAGRAVGEAVIRFFERFPPGSGTGAGEGR